MLLLGVVQAQFQAALAGDGYTFGGNAPSTVTNRINKFSFSTDTISVLTATTSASARASSGSSNSGTAGYYKLSASQDTVVNKLFFEAETNAALATGMSGNSSVGLGFANSGVASYIGRGRTAGGTSSPGVDKFAHPTDTRSTTTSTSTDMSENPFSFANSGTAGYAGGGYNYGTSANVTAVNKFAFPSDTRSTLSSLDSGIGLFAGAENKGVAGYGIGGRPDGGSPTRNAFKITFSTDTRTTVTNFLAVAKSVGAHAGVSQSGIAAYYFGGTTGSVVNTIEKIPFSTETGSAIAATLTAATVNFAGLSNNGASY